MSDNPQDADSESDSEPQISCCKPVQSDVSTPPLLVECKPVRGDESKKVSPEKTECVEEYDGRVPSSLERADIGVDDPRAKYQCDSEAFMKGFSRYVHNRTKIATASKKAQLINTAKEFVCGGSHPYGKVGEPSGSRHIMLLGGFRFGTVESAERDAYIKRISRNAVKDKSQGYFKLTYNHLLEFERWVLVGEPPREEEEQEKLSEVVETQPPKRQRSKDTVDVINDVRSRYADYLRRRAEGEDVDAIVRPPFLRPDVEEEEDDERPVIYVMRLTGSGSMVWYDRATDTFTTKTPIYAIGVCLHGGRKRQERLQAACGAGDWRLRHIADISFDRMHFANLLIHERLQNYGGLHSTVKRRLELGVSQSSVDCFCFHGRDEYEHAVSVVNETCEALRESPEGQMSC